MEGRQDILKNYEICWWKMMGFLIQKDDKIFETSEALAYLYDGNPAELIKLVHEMKISRYQAENIVNNYCREHNFTEEQREKCLLDLKY